MSKGYWVVRANVNDADEYSKYVQIATDIIAKYDGRFLIRGGDQMSLKNQVLKEQLLLNLIHLRMH